MGLKGGRGLAFEVLDEEAIVLSLHFFLLGL